MKKLFAFILFALVVSCGQETLNRLDKKTKSTAQVVAIATPMPTPTSIPNPSAMPSPSPVACDSPGSYTCVPGKPVGTDCKNHKCYTCRPSSDGGGTCY